MKGLVRAMVVVLAITAAGCFGEEEEKLPPVVVGAKTGTEQRILAELVAQKLEASGIPAERKFDLGTTADCDAAIRSGKIDVYVEYGGTALTQIVRSQSAGTLVTQGPDVILARLRSEYTAAGLVWTEPIGLDVPYAIVVRAGSGAASMAEAAAAAHGWRAGFSFEFQSRPDGFPAAKRGYNLDFAEVKTIDAAKLYQALADHSVDAVEGHATDAALAKLRLLALEDDRHAFGINPAIPVVRKATLEMYPGVKGALDGLYDTVHVAQMREMNEKVENAGQSPADVVRQFWADQSLF